MPNFWIPSGNLRQLWNQAHERRFSFKNGSICSTISFVNDYQRVYLDNSIPGGCLDHGILQASLRCVQLEVTLKALQVPGDKAGDTPAAVLLLDISGYSCGWNAEDLRHWNLNMCFSIDWIISNIVVT